MSALLLLLFGFAQPDCENTVTQGDMTECAAIAYREADDALTESALLS